jgi:hypothetical protein
MNAHEGEHLLKQRKPFCGSVVPADVVTIANVAAQHHHAVNPI